MHHSTTLQCTTQPRFKSSIHPPYLSICHLHILQCITQPPFNASLNHRSDPLLTQHPLSRFLTFPLNRTRTHPLNALFNHRSDPLLTQHPLSRFLTFPLNRTRTHPLAQSLGYIPCTFLLIDFSHTLLLHH